MSATLWGFINPKRTAGRIPLGRTAIAIQIVGAAIFLGYTLAKKDIRLPFSAEPYTVEVRFPDAKGLDASDEPSAAVAGSPVGRVSDVRYENGFAVATLDLDSDVRGKIFADAEAAIRPASALQNLLVNIDPGTPDAGELPSGEVIPPERTDTFVSVDELTSVFDADTQAYTQILITEVERALRGRDAELSASLQRLGRLTSTAQPVTKALAERRLLLAELVGHLDETFSTVSLRGEQLGQAIDAGSRTLAVTADREAELTTATRRLGPLVAEAQRSLAAASGVTVPLAPALKRLAPAARSLPLTARRLRGLIARAHPFLGDVDRLTREGRVPLQTLLIGTEGLQQKAEELVPVSRDLTVRAALLDRYKGGIPQLADVFSGAFSTSDNGGIYGQVSVLGFEPLKPENFGFAAFPRSGGGGRATGLERGLAEALELSCRSQSEYACLIRNMIDGLPAEPVLGGEN